MSVKTVDREWLLDYSHHQADFSKGKKQNQKDSTAASSPKQRDTNSLLTFSFRIFIISPIYHPKSEKSHSKQFLVNISQNKGILRIEQPDSFNIIAILSSELH